MASAGSSVQPDPQDVQEVPDRRNERLAPLAFHEVDLQVDNENEQLAQAPQANPDHVNEQSPAEVAPADDQNRIQPAPDAPAAPGTPAPREAAPLLPGGSGSGQGEQSHSHHAARHLQGEHGSGPGEKFHSLTQIWRDLLVSDKGVSAVTVLHSYGYFISILMTLWGWNEFLEFGRKSTLVMQIIIQLVGFSVSALGVNACYTKKPSRLSLFFVYQLIHTILVFFSLYYMFRTSRKELFPDYVAEPYYNMRLVDQPFGMDWRLKDLAAQPAYEVSLLYFRAVYMLLVTNVFNIYTLYSVGKKLWNQHQQVPSNGGNQQGEEMQELRAQNGRRAEGAAPGNVQPGNSQPGNVQPGNVQPENVPPGNVQPENVPPGNVQPENVPPGNVQPENVPPGNVQPGNVQPENVQPGNVVPENAQRGNVGPRNVPPRNVVPMAFFSKVGLLFGCEPPPTSNDNGQNGQNENVAVEYV